MILMSKYKGQHGGKRVKKFGQGPPPPLFGQCPEEIDFLCEGFPLYKQHIGKPHQENPARRLINTGGSWEVGEGEGNLCSWQAAPPTFKLSDTQLHTSSHRGRSLSPHFYTLIDLSSHFHTWADYSRRIQSRETISGCDISTDGSDVPKRFHPIQLLSRLCSSRGTQLSHLWITRTALDYKIAPLLLGNASDCAKWN